MNEIRTLLEHYWVCKDQDKEAYYRVKHDIPLFQRFLREQLGWKLIHTEHLIKIEKIPAKAHSYMGIQEFAEIRDYVLLCAALMYLEDKEEQEQFLLSELIGFVETALKPYLEVDWTSFTQRKSLVRVLQYMERLQMLRVYDGNTEGFGAEAGQEVLYENTGYSKYYATAFPMDISEFTSWEDFERVSFEGLSEEQVNLRVNRIYRQLVAGPAMFWEEQNEKDALYIRSQRQWITRYIGENVGGRLDLHRNAAFWMLEPENVFGTVHPRDAMLPEAVLLVCTELAGRIRSEELPQEGNGRAFIPEEELNGLILACREKWREGWSKEYREMDDARLVRLITDYMLRWLMLEPLDDGYAILPSVGKLSAAYPADFVSGS